MEIELVIEKSEGLLWGRAEGKNWLPTPFGNTYKEVIENL